jgi:hypothetical protein
MARSVGRDSAASATGGSAVLLPSDTEIERRPVTRRGARARIPARTKTVSEAGRRDGRGATRNGMTRETRRDRTDGRTAINQRPHPATHSLWAARRRERAADAARHNRGRLVEGRRRRQVGSTTCKSQYRCVRSLGSRVLSSPSNGGGADGDDDGDERKLTFDVGRVRAAE